MTGTGKELLLRPDVGKRDWVGFVKGAAIILIVAYHVTLFLNGIGFDAAGIGRAKLVLELFPMPAFFLISGMFHSRVGSWSFPDLWRRRLRQYLYLYVLWSVLRFVFYVVAPNVRSDGAGASARDPLALLGILVWPISSYWFIYALFIFSVVLWLFRKASPWVLLGLSGVLSVLSSSGILDVDNAGIDRMTEYLFFFAIGAYFHRRVYSWAERMRPWQAIAITGAFLGLAAVVTLVPSLAGVPGTALIGQMLAIATGFALAIYLVRLRWLGWVDYVGARSLNIYLVHVFVIALLAIPLAMYPQIDAVLPGRGLVLVFLLTAIVIVVSIVITRYATRVSWLFVYPFRRSRKTAAPATGRPAEGREPS